MCQRRRSHCVRNRCNSTATTTATATATPNSPTVQQSCHPMDVHPRTLIFKQKACSSASKDGGPRMSVSASSCAVWHVAASAGSTTCSLYLHILCHPPWNTTGRNEPGTSMYRMRHAPCPLASIHAVCFSFVQALPRTSVAICYAFARAGDEIALKCTQACWVPAHDLRGFVSSMSRGREPQDHRATQPTSRAP